MNVAFTELASDNRHYFLYRALAPLKPFLDDRDVVEISVNRPGQVYVERLGAAHMEFHDIPELTTAEIVNIGERVAARTHQFVSPATPILSAALPPGERIQVGLPPAASDGGWGLKNSLSCAPCCAALSLRTIPINESAAPETAE